MAARNRAAKVVLGVAIAPAAEDSNGLPTGIGWPLRVHRHEVLLAPLAGERLSFSSPSAHAWRRHPILGP